MPDAESRRAQRARTRKPRGRGLRTRTGCITCRRRHIKCDEATPSCGPCMKSSHSCEYADAAQSRSKAQPQSTESEPEQPLNASAVITQNDIVIASFSQPSADDTGNAFASATFGDSPGSSVSLARPAIGTATAGWFGLLLDDAALEFDADSGQSFYPLGQETAVQDSNLLARRPSILSPAEQSSIAEHSKWQCSEQIQLSSNECLLFDNFVRRVGRWLDLFDPDDHFTTLVPRLAMYNLGLMNAILALSVRHISLNPDVASNIRHDRADALKYYYETLHYLHKAMQYDTFKTSLELLATSLIVSTYEMLDGSRQDWERHLKGVFWIQRSQVIHGDSGGLKQANWWAWLCQDVWAAFREKRKVFTFWKHPRTFDQLNEHELACRSVYMFSKAVNFCSKEEIEADRDNVQARITKAETLLRMFDEWQSLLTTKFSPLPIDTTFESDIFPPIWIHPSPFAVAVQLSHAGRILVYLHRPYLGGLSEFMQHHNEVKKCINTICGIAKPLSDDAAALMSSQCLYIAGLCIQDDRQRETVLKLIEACRRRTGWPIKPLDDELQALWSFS